MFSRSEWKTLAGLYGTIAALHVAGFGLFLAWSPSVPALVGLGLAAYLLGLRHAFDADHIAAVDDTVRYMMQRGRSPLGVGFFFSLGHSTIVLLVALAVAFAAASVRTQLPLLRETGTLIGTGVAAIFLLLVGALNLRILLGIAGAWKAARAGRHDHAALDRMLAQRGGLLRRLTGGRMRRFVEHSWHMYPVGLLFGLGFDTASEIALLAMTAGASAALLPVPAVLCLPLLFAAGMSAMDTTDGVVMCKAYGWALDHPLRRIFYNFATTGLSVTVALVIGSVQLAQVVVGGFDLQGPASAWIRGIDFGTMGFAVVGAFALLWATALLFWRFGRR